MSSKNLILVGFVVLLAGVYVTQFTDWGKRDVIQVNVFTRPIRIAPAGDGPTTLPVAFNLDRDFDLSDVKVIPLDALKTNKNPKAIWHMVHGDKPHPNRGFGYGIPIDGMKNAPDCVQPEPLVVGTTYRILVESGKTKGFADFTAVEAGAP